MEAWANGGARDGVPRLAETRETRRRLQTRRTGARRHQQATRDLDVAGPLMEVDGQVLVGQRSVYLRALPRAFSTGYFSPLSSSLLRTASGKAIPVASAR